MIAAGFWLLTIVVPYAIAQQCNSAYGTYLDCIKGKLDANYAGFEKEFGDDYKNLAFSCFSTSPSDAVSGKACVVKNINALDNAFDASGPLGECQTCLKLAQQVQKMFLDAPESNMACIRKTVSEVIGQQMSKCVKEKEPSFVMPPIPDFDEKSQSSRKQIIDNLGIFVQVDNVLARCERNSARNSARAKRSAYSNSDSCINKMVLNGKPIWPMHCTAMKDCRGKVSSSCQADFGKVQGIACDCIEKGRQEIHKLIDTTGQKLVDVAKATSPNGGGCTGDLSAWKECRCKAVVNEIFSSGQQRAEVDAVLKKIVACTNLSDKDKELISSSKLTEVGCKRLAQPGNAGLVSAVELATGVDFMGNLLDALVARVTRFCPNASCPA